MKISNYAEEVIKGYEGLHLETYRCPSGVLTIGYGHTKNVKTGENIDKATAEKLFVEDVEAVERLIDRETYVLNLSQNQYDAIVSFIYNIGWKKFNGSTLRKKLIKDTEDPDIPDEIRRWVYGTVPGTGKKNKLPGLVKRREWEAQMYNDL